MLATRRLTLFTTTYGQGILIIPFLLVAPSYFAGTLTMGAIFQASNAFAQVQTALSWIVTSYADLTTWLATVARLAGFQQSVVKNRQGPRGPVVEFGDGKSLHWMVGDTYHSRTLDDSFAFLPGAPAKLPEPETAKSVSIGLSVPLDRPDGQIALVGGRIITMDGEQVIEDGTVLVENQRIVAVGKRADVDVPASAKVIDISGKTLMRAEPNERRPPP